MFLDLILSICFLSLNVVVEASGTDMEMKGYTISRIY